MNPNWGSSSHFGMSGTTGEIKTNVSLAMPS
jgi:hypothetical protein